MSYFNKFNDLVYGFSGGPRKRFNLSRVTNITTRVKIVNTFNKNAIYNYNNYIIQDGERPDTIAQKEYNDSNLHWIILLFNEIKNPLFEWPKNNFDMENYVNEKYKGTSIFLNIHGVQTPNETPTDEFCRCFVDQFPFSSYEIPPTTSIKLKKQNIVYEGTVLSFNTSNGELRVFFEIQDFSPNEIYTEPDSYSEILLQVKNHSTQRTEEIDIKNSCLKIVNSTKNSLHHFEKNKNYIDYFVRYSEVLDDSYLEGSNRIASLASGTEFFYDKNFCFSETIFGTYLGCRSDAFVENDYIITNLKYEYEENEKRREIILPRRDSISSIIKTFNRLVREP